MNPWALSDDSWDLHRRAEGDKNRHTEKIKELIRENLGEVVGQHNIISGDGREKIKIPIRGLELPRIRFDPNNRQHIGQGNGGSKPNDVLGRAPQPGKDSAGKKAGDRPGVDYYETEITLAELRQMVFDELSLPKLEDKGINRITSESIEFNSIAKKGIEGNLDRKRTLIEAYKRNAREGNSDHPWSIRNEDKRFKVWDEEVDLHRNAVIFAMRDVSGSMGEFEALLSRALYGWMNAFLKIKYDCAETVFITCQTEAKEVTEDQFFAAQGNGGTKLSASIKLTRELIDQRYNPRDWNIYPFLISDGMNLPHDNSTLITELDSLLNVSNLFGYGETHAQGSSQSGFAPLGQSLASNYPRNHPLLKMARMSSIDDVWPTLKTFLSDRDAEVRRFDQVGLR